MTYIIIALALALFFVIGLYLNRLQSHHTLVQNYYWLEEKYRQAGIHIVELKEMSTVQAYEALDQGMTELQDAYATDMAQYEETIVKLRQHIGVLQAEKDEVKDVLDQIEAEVGTFPKDVGAIDV